MLDHLDIRDLFRIYRDFQRNIAMEAGCRGFIGSRFHAAGGFRRFG